MSFCFVHAADLHLDTPFEGLGSIAPEIQSTLRDASLDAFDDLIELCIREDAAFLLLSGDIYDGADRGVRAQFRFLRGLERLAEHQIPTLITHGNHDPLDGWSAIRTWPSTVTVFPSDRVESVSIERGGEVVATVYGISYGEKVVTENLALRYQRGSGPGIHIGMLHCTVGSPTEHESYSRCTVSDLLNIRMDYWALGHIHKRSILHDDNPWVVYPGNLQGRSPKPSELGAKGALIVTVDGGTIAEPRFVPLDRVRFHAFDLDTSNLPDLPALRKSLGDETERIRATHEGRGVILRSTLVGRSLIHRDLLQNNAVDDLLRDLRDEWSGSQPIVWWGKITDATRSVIDREVVRGQDTFSSEVLRLVEEVPASMHLQEQLQSGLGLPRFVQTSRHGLDLDDFDMSGLLEEAEDVLLDLLESGSER